MPQFLEPEGKFFEGPMFPADEPEVPVPSFKETFGAAFRQENDVFAAADLLRRQAFPRQQDFNLLESLKLRGQEWVDRGHELVGVQSDAELDDRIARIKKEEGDRDTLYRAGIPGFVAMAAAGAVSPTSLIPFIRGATGIRSIAAGAMSVAAGAAAQEAVLFANQETRTRGEAGFSIAASTVLGGILGAVGHTLRPRDIERMASDMVRAPGTEAISPPTPFSHESTVGAAATPTVIRDAGKLKKGWGAQFLSPLSPVTRGFEQWNAPRPLKDAGGSTQVRRMTAGFTQSGLGLEENKNFVSAVAGGNVEDLKRTYAAISYKGHKAIDDAFIEYALDGARGIMKKERAIWAAKRAPDKLDYAQFKTAITEALWRGLPADTDPHVLRAAKQIDEQVYKPLYDEAVEVGIFTGEEKLVGDMGYANRIYNNEAIIRRRSDFIKLLANNYAKNLEKQFSEGVAKITERTAKDQQLLEDMALTVEEVKKLRDELQGKKAKLEADAPDKVKTILSENRMRKDVLRDLQARIKEGAVAAPGETPAGALKRLEEVAKMKQQADMIAEAIKDKLGLGGEDLQKFLADKKAIDRRLWSLAKAHGLAEEKLQKKLMKIEANEEAQIDTLLRAQKKLQKFMKFIDSASPGMIDAELSKLKDSFNTLAEKFDKLDEVRVRLESTGYDELTTKEQVVTRAGTVADPQAYDVVGYHGSTDIIDKFQGSKTKIGQGIFFSAEPSFANRFATGDAAGGDTAMMLGDNSSAEISNFIHQSLGDGKGAELDKLLKQYDDAYAEMQKIEEKYGTDYTGRAEDKTWLDASGKVHELSQQIEPYLKEATALTTGSPNMQRVKLKLGKTFEYKFKKGFDYDEEAAVIEKARKEGYDSVTFKLAPKKGSGADETFYSVLKDENIIDETGPRKVTQGGQDPALALGERLDDTQSKMDKIAAKIDSLETYDLNAFNAEVNQMMRDIADTHARINAKRVLRNEKLWRGVENLSPEKRAAMREALGKKIKERPAEFIGRWQGRASDIDLLNGKADFTAHAEELAEQVTRKILGTERRLAYSDIIRNERGPELARLLNIPSTEIKDFLETDIEKQVAIYTRTLGSDISIARVFGSPDAAEEFAKLTQEMEQNIKSVDGMTDKKGNPLSDEAKEKLRVEYYKFYEDARKDLYVLLERAKSLRGIPRDPDSWSARAARTAMDLNYLRYMGGVVISSVADPARAVMRHGLMRTMRDGVLPMITNLKAIRMSQREAKLAGTALDQVMHTRMYSLTDIFDDAYRGTVAERGIHYASTRLGSIALFDLWNSSIKQFSAGVINARLLDSIALVNGEKGSAKAIAKAQEFLARNNIDEELAQTIWKEVTNGKGGGKVNGFWLPNTEEWNVADPAVARARRAYRAALASEVDSTIVTPGFERPNWVDSSTPARLIAQFRSFGFSSTQKTLMAGLQEHDAAFFNGAMISLALGALSYYLWATMAGGDAYDEMMKLEPEKWADEMITRSGLTGIFDEVQRTAQRIPVLRDYASLSGKRSTRREGGDLIEGILGPSFDMLDKGATILSGIDEPTRQTLHAARQLLPFQNVFYFRQLLDKVEQTIDLPERRK